MIALLVGAPLVGCDTGPPAPPAAVVVDTVRDYVRNRGGDLTVENPRTGEVVALRLEELREGMRITEGGRYVVSGLFQDADGTPYGLDFYVDQEGSNAVTVEDVVLQQVAGENVLSEARRTDLDQAD